MVFNDFSRFGGSKLASFSYVFRVSVPRSFFDRLGVGFGVDFGAVWAPKWGLCWGVWGVWFGVDFGMVSGGVWVLPKSRAGQKLVVIYTLAGALRKQNRLLIFEHRPLDEGQ